MKTSLRAKLFRASSCVAFTALLLGCRPSQEITVQSRDGKIATGKEFNTTDSSIVILPVLTDVKTSGASYQKYTDTTVLLFAQIQNVTLKLPEPASSDRVLGGIVGGAIGATLGVWAGSEAGFGPSGGLFSGGGGPWTVVSAAGGGVAGSGLGIWLGLYVVDLMNIKTLHIDPAMPTWQEVLGKHASNRADAEEKSNGQVEMQNTE